MPVPQPNILYLHSHDTGRFVQPYGHAVATPHLQEFARAGVLFRQAFSAAPTCSPSRAALLTGEYPHACGMHGLASPPWNYRLRHPSHLLPRVLAQHGYATVLGGVHHVGGKSLAEVRAHGFHTFLNEDNLCEDVPDLHERAAHFLAHAPRDAPWFMAIGFDQTHRDNRQGDPTSGRCFSQPTPYDPDALDWRNCHPPPTIPDTPETRRDLASFNEGVRLLDARIGHVLGALASSGLAENTLVIVTTDHGIAFPGMKGSLTDLGTSVMLMLRGPGGFAGGRTFDALTTQLDVFPTIAELAGLEGCDWLQGKSLLPLVRGEVAHVHDHVFSEPGWHEVAEPQRAVRTLRHKLIRRFDPLGPKAANCDEGPTKNVMRAAGFFDRPLGDELLFDLARDPHELANRIDDLALAEVRTELRATLDDWMARTRDPLAHGESIAPPANSR